MKCSHQLNILRLSFFFFSADAQTFSVKNFWIKSQKAKENITNNKFFKKWFNAEMICASTIFLQKIRTESFYCEKVEKPGMKAQELSVKKLNICKFRYSEMLNSGLNKLILMKFDKSVQFNTFTLSVDFPLTVQLKWNK